MKTKMLTGARRMGITFFLNASMALGAQQAITNTTLSNIENEAKSHSAIYNFWYLDADQDGLGDVTNVMLSEAQPVNYVANFDDEDDTVAAIIISEDLQTWFMDEDGDGVGDPYNVMLDFTKPTGYVAEFSCNIDSNDAVCIMTGDEIHIIKNKESH